MGEGGLGYGPVRFGLAGLGRSIDRANQAARTPIGHEQPDMGDPHIPPVGVDFPQAELAKIGDCGCGQKARTRSRR